jgi:hypothetical protein
MKAFACLLLAAALGLMAGSASRAETGRYPLDWALDYCRSQETGFTALAVADFGASWCAWDWPSLADARREAIAGCRRSIPAPLREGANCAVIYENGQIVDQRRAAQMRRDIRMPVRIESYNGQRRETETFDGFLTMGAAPDELTRTVEVFLADGTPLCVGAARIRKLAPRFGFTATCFGDQVFRGEARLTGLVRIDGLNRLGFDLRISNPPHRARITTE